MQNNITSFELVYRGSTIMVSRHPVAGTTIYHISFSGGKSPLVITRASNPDNEKWWTSIPEGRLAEAREIGKLIEDRLRTNT